MDRRPQSIDDLALYPLFTTELLQLMRDNKHPSGNMAILVNAPRTGLRSLADVRNA